jgi:putative spermidine/putrescine transport system substrate-binding protein
MEGLWAELDPKKIPNMANLFKVAKHSKYTIFTNVGPYNLIYNSKHIKTPPTSWEDLWNPAYKNRVILYPFHSVGTICLLILSAQQKGGDINNIDPGMNRLVELHKSGNLIGMPPGESEMISLFELEEAWIGPLTNGRVKNLWDKGATFIKIVRPKPTFGMITSMNVVKTSKNPDLAMKFVNFALGVACQEAYGKFNLYAPTVDNAKVPPEVKDLMLNEADMNRLFLVDWVTINKVRAQWEERWNKMISK